MPWWRVAPCARCPLCAAPPVRGARCARCRPVRGVPLCAVPPVRGVPVALPPCARYSQTHGLASWGIQGRLANLIGGVLRPSAGATHLRRVRPAVRDAARAGERRPGTRVYPCTQHLPMNVEEIIRIGKLRGQSVASLVHQKTFVRRSDYDALVADVVRLHKDQVAWEMLSKDQKEGANRLDGWLTAKPAGDREVDQRTARSADDRRVGEPTLRHQERIEVPAQGASEPEAAGSPVDSASASAER